MTEKKKLEIESENVPIKTAFEMAEKKSKEKEVEEPTKFGFEELARTGKRVLTPVGKEIKESAALTKKEAVSTLSEYKPSEVLKRKIAEREFERQLKREYVHPVRVERQASRLKRQRMETQRPIDYSLLVGSSSYGKTKKQPQSQINMLGGNQNTNLFGNPKGKSSNLLSMGNPNYNLLGGNQKGKKKQIKLI
jgi:hypothetical protein